MNSENKDRYGRQNPDAGGFITRKRVFAPTAGFAKTSMAAVLVWALLWGSGCDRGDSNSPARGNMPGMMGQGMQTSAAIPVQVAVAKRGDISMFLLHTTTIEAEKEVDVVAKVSGQVVKLPAEEGLEVKQSDVLAQMDEAELQIDLLQAKVRMDTDKASFDRAKNMLEKKLISEENYDAARLQYESSKATYEAARLKTDYTTVRSPLAGVVTVRNVELGQRVTANQVLFRIADFRPLRARIYVPEKDMGRLFEGQSAKITIESEPGVEFQGIVKMISPIVDPTSGTVKVTVDIEDSRHKLKPGMFASVYITTETHKNTLLIPKKALLLESESDQVYYYDKGIARKASLKIGFVSGDVAEVLDGLQEGDQVVTIGQDGLREGLPIRIPGQEPMLTQAGKDSSHAGMVTAAMAADEAPSSSIVADGNVDPEMIKRLEEKFLRNPMSQQAYQTRVAEDPDFANNPAKKLKFFEDMVKRFEDRMLQNESIRTEYQKRLNDDPGFKNNLEKKMDFFREMGRKMWGGNRQ